MSHVIIDGKLFASDRLGEQTTSVKGQQIDAWYSGKAHAHGGNIQALSAPDGEDVPSSVELRWRPDDHQAAVTVSV